MHYRNHLNYKLLFSPVVGGLRVFSCTQIFLVSGITLNMFRSWLCCYRPHNRSNSVAVHPFPRTNYSNTAARRHYRFHTAIVGHQKRNHKNRRKIMNHTMFVLPGHVQLSSNNCIVPASIIDLESPTKVTRPVFCMTVVPESKVDKLPATSATKLADVAKSEVEDKQQTSVIVKNQIESDLIAKPIYWRNNQDPDNSSKGRLDDINSMSYTTLAVTTEKPASNIKLYASSVDIQSLNNNDKPVAEVKPTKNVKPLEERKKSTTVLPKNIQRKSSDVQGSSLAPFDNPNRISELISVQISSNEWEAVVTGLQNISRLVMFHGKELRLNSFQPYGRLIAKHIRCLRSQVARAACTATQKIFTYVPKALEPDIEEIASALFPRTADTNKFLREQSSEALNAMVDKVNPCKCVLVVAAKGVKHGNRLVRAEACRLLSKIVDKLGVNGTLYLPTEARDAVITSATSLVFDNTPSSRQAAQRILAKLSEDPRGASLISLAASPNVKATLNKSMSRIFLK